MKIDEPKTPFVHGRGLEGDDAMGEWRDERSNWMMGRIELRETLDDVLHSRRHEKSSDQRCCHTKGR